MEFFSYTGFFLINLISRKRRVFSQPCQGGWAAGDLPPDLWGPGEEGQLQAAPRVHGLPPQAGWEVEVQW